jgi:hypothetical protein
MYVRQFGYTIVPGQEEKAVTLCGRFVEALRERGIAAQILVGGRDGSTLQLVEEYVSREAMYAARAALEGDASYRSAASGWAAEFYPLVAAAAPALLLHDRQAA